MSTASSTLHQLCHAPSMWANCIGQIAAVWQPLDALVLLGPAAQGVFDPRLATFTQLYVLQSDLNVLGIPAEQIRCKILNYDQWAQLVLTYQRHISWK